MIPELKELSQVVLEAATRQNQLYIKLDVVAIGIWLVVTILLFIKQIDPDDWDEVLKKTFLWLARIVSLACLVATIFTLYMRVYNPQWMILQDIANTIK